MEPTYYRVNASKATYVECWRATRNLFEFVLICFLKTFRLSLPATYAVTNEGFRRLEWNELVEDSQRSLRPIRSEFEAIGYRYCFCYCHPTLGTMRSATMTMLSGDHNSWASVLCESHQTGTYVHQVVVTSVRSALSNGDFLLTCDLQEPFPPEFLCERRARYSAAQLARHHNERITAASPAYPISLTDDAAVEQRLLDVERRVFQYNLDRGILIPLSADETERFQAAGQSSKTTPPPAIPEPRETPFADTDLVDPDGEPVYDAALAEVPTGAPASRYPGVMLELEKIRDKKGSWLSGAVILGISVLLFLGAGAAQWDWHFALLLIPVLLFHELGHFVAMRIFKYRNLKMFFIPLLGAAVTGQNYNVAGWKKAIVSLAGPVPGIFVGGVIGVIAIVLGDQPLLEAAALAVFLNAFNLLPFLPLDGGWIVHVLLFSRHHVLDTFFRFLAAMTLILSGFLGFRILMFIGIMMLIGLRSAYRVARVASEIRDAGIDTSSPDGQRIPIETADAIISRLEAAAPLPVPDAIKAQQTLQVFESVNARPPGVLGTLALVGVHGGSLVFAMILCMTFWIVILQGAAIAPQNHYECGTAKQWPLSEDRLPLETASTVAATFSSVDDAEAAFAETKAILPKGASVTHFGQSVMVTLDAASRQVDELVERFESAGAAVEIKTPTEPLVITLEATLKTAAQALVLEKEANEYFSLPAEMAVIPPWDVDREVTELQKTARRTYQELKNFRPYEDNRYTEVSLRMMESIEQKDEAKTQAILQEQQALVLELQQEYNERLLARDDLDKGLIEIYSRQPQMPDWIPPAAEAVDEEGEADVDEIDETNRIDGKQLAAQAEWLAELRAWQLEMGARMGQLPLAGTQPIPAVHGIVGSGGVQRSELMLRFRIEFNQPDEGMLAIANWLCGYNCMDVKYSFGDVEQVKRF